MDIVDTLLRIAAFGIGLLGLVVFFRSILRVAFLNRRSRDAFATALGRGARHVMTAIARRQRDYRQVQDTMGWGLPLFLLLMIAAWFVLVQIAFALIIWAVKAEPSGFQAFISSGSALSTLGFYTPSSGVGELLAILEGAFGLGIIVFMFTFIPGYASAVQDREDKVAWLYARAGAQPTISSLIEWCHRAGQADDMTPIWNDWEHWFTGITETHTLTPLLALAPSVYPERTWLGAAAAMLDTASLSLSTLDARGLESAKLCHEAGCNTLKLLAREFRIGDLDVRQTGLSDSEAAFDVSYERLRAAGMPVKPARGECRQAFLTLRARYEGAIRHIAVAALMPISEPWVLPQEKGNGAEPR